MKKFLSGMTALAVGLALLGAGARAMADEEHEHAPGESTHGAATADETDAETITVTGEILDMACYIDHGARGEKHAGCAKKCIESGLPVGIRSDAGKTYLLIGEHETMNKQLAPYAAKTITVRGKAVERDGFRMIENAEIVSTKSK